MLARCLLHFRSRKLPFSLPCPLSSLVDLDVLVPECLEFAILLFVFSSSPCRREPIPYVDVFRSFLSDLDAFAVVLYPPAAKFYTNTQLLTSAALSLLAFPGIRSLLPPTGPHAEPLPPVSSTDRYREEGRSCGHHAAVPFPNPTLLVTRVHIGATIPQSQLATRCRDHANACLIARLVSFPYYRWSRWATDPPHCLSCPKSAIIPICHHYSIGFPRLPILPVCCPFGRAHHLNVCLHDGFPVMCVDQTMYPVVFRLPCQRPSACVFSHLGGFGCPS